MVPTTPRALGAPPFPRVELLPPRLLQREEGGVHHVTHVHVGEVTAEVLERHPGKKNIEMFVGWLAA